MQQIIDEYKYNIQEDGVVTRLDTGRVILQGVLNGN